MENHTDNGLETSVFTGIRVFKNQGSLHGGIKKRTVAYWGV